jgi:DNA mismatch repair protein MutS
VAKLVERGYKVAICEQVEDPALAKKLVRREVTQVITPGLVTDTDMIEAKEPRYLLAVAVGKERFGFSYLDLTTGEFRVGQEQDPKRLEEEIGRIAPHEILVAAWGTAGMEEEVEAEVAAWAATGARTGRVRAEPPDPDEAFKRLSAHFGVSDLGGYELEGLREGFSAACVALDYVAENHKAGLPNVRMLARHVGRDVMFIGEATRRNLELFQTLSGERRKGTLLSLMDRTRTAMGGRELRRWLAFPLLDVEEIRRRHDAVGELMGRGDTRKRLREALREVGDVERLTGRVAMASANARELVQLRRALAALPGIVDLISDAECDLLRHIATNIDTLPEVAELLFTALADDPPAVVTEGGIIREGYDAEIDELREIQRGGRSWIAQLQAEERERTGVGSLKIGFNKVFGYYIEISRARLGDIPVHYERRQTLANAERFVTPELKQMEAKVLGAEERAHSLEYQRFVEVRDRAALYLDRLYRTAAALARLDSLAALAELAVERRYVRPQVHEGYEFVIAGGRHPVVEAVLADERFVPNDVAFDRDNNRLLVITGPNMSGKSTILRQTALIALMAQMGSFVPAESARIGLVDRIFTRVGASDDLARGRSTFMVEMTETATILLNATGRSLVILDEIGRGTSTFDGLSIAWAVAEYIHRKGARTLFATHYHELTDLARTMKGVANYNVAVKKWQGKIIFLRRLVEGGVNRSYGIEVADLAGLPSEVVERAKEVLENLETGELDEAGVPRFAISERMALELPHRQLDLFLGGGDVKRDRLIEEITALAVEEMTPLDALVRLDELRRAARDLKRRGEDE